MTIDRRHPGVTRRGFLQSSATGLAAATLASLPRLARANDEAAGPAMRFGLVTYQWGKDMDLPTLIDACEKSGLLGIELRTEHAHRVEPNLSDAQRQEVRKRFEDSPVELVGYGSNAQFHEDDPQKVRENIELTRQYVRLMHDCGGGGVKVKPNGFARGVPQEKTIAQIGRALNIVAAYGADFGQKIRVEAHGSGTSALPVMKAIFDVADHPNVGICWNSNGEDLQGDGLAANFNLVKHRFGDTVHVRELNDGDYPYAELMRLFLDMNYSGWILLEGRKEPADKITAMIQQREVFEKLTAR